LSQTVIISERPTFWLLFKEITKFRLSISVLFSSVAGYFLGAESIGLDFLALLVIGGYCMVGASNVFNQIIERDLDQGHCLQGI
jgi:heme o synthase